MSATETTIAKNDSKIPENDSLLYLLPEEIDLDPVVEIRGTSDGDMTDDELRASIVANGQVQACLVRSNGSGGYRMVAGHRRREQINLLNMEASADAEPMRVMCVVRELTDEQALRDACTENLQRKNMNAMQEARLIVKVRDQFKWTGGRNSKKVAEFLGKSPAWVTEREKLLALDEATQDKIQSGILSANAALALPAVEPDRVDEVIAEAKELQMAENVKKGVKVKLVADGDGKAKVQPIAAKHIKAAARKKQALKPGEFKSLNRGEVLDLFAGYRNSIPHLYAPVQEFIVYLLDKFVTGKGSLKTAEAKFEAMIAPACKGVKCEPEQEEVKEPKKVKVAKAAKPAKVSKPKGPKFLKPSKETAKREAAKKLPKAPKAPKSPEVIV